MKLTLTRFFSDKDLTIGILQADGFFKCFTLEDEFRRIKVKGETRIPEGEYTVKLRNEGGMNEKYKVQFGSNHKGMLWLQNVPGFEYVYIHIGNTERQTEGCILVGMTIMLNNGQYSIGHSIPAYTKLYSELQALLSIGEPVTIKIIDIERK